MNTKSKRRNILGQKLLVTIAAIGWYHQESTLQAATRDGKILPGVEVTVSPLFHRTETHKMYPDHDGLDHEEYRTLYVTVTWKTKQKVSEKKLEHLAKAIPTHLEIPGGARGGLWLLYSQFSLDRMGEESPYSPYQRLDSSLDSHSHKIVMQAGDSLKVVISHPIAEFRRSEARDKAQVAETANRAIRHWLAAATGCRPWLSTEEGVQCYKSIVPDSHLRTSTHDKQHHRSHVDSRAIYDSGFSDRDDLDAIPAGLGGIGGYKKSRTASSLPIGVKRGYSPPAYEHLSADLAPAWRHHSHLSSRAIDDSDSSDSYDFLTSRPVSTGLYPGAGGREGSGRYKKSSFPPSRASRVLEDFDSSDSDDDILPRHRFSTELYLGAGGREGSGRYNTAPYIPWSERDGFTSSIGNRGKTACDPAESPCSSRDRRDSDLGGMSSHKKSRPTSDLLSSGKPRFSPAEYAHLSADNAPVWRHHSHLSSRAIDDLDSLPAARWRFRGAVDMGELGSRPFSGTASALPRMAKEAGFGSMSRGGSKEKKAHLEARPISVDIATQTSKLEGAPRVSRAKRVRVDCGTEPIIPEANSAVGGAHLIELLDLPESELGLPELDPEDLNTSGTADEISLQAARLGKITARMAHTRKAASRQFDAFFEMFNTGAGGSEPSPVDIDLTTGSPIKGQVSGRVDSADGSTFEVED
ncbi:MAG: hypothetical protein LBI20_03600 [Holosporales bacterium]|nr:hypothetical protein [Holosporales bacterium]